MFKKLAIGIIVITFLINLCVYTFKNDNNQFGKQLMSKDNDSIQTNIEANKYEAAIKKMETTMQSAWDDLHSPSVMLILEDGEKIYEKSFGSISPSSQQAWTGDHTSNIGSVSKIYVTTAIVKLHQDGLINLDSPVTNYIPEFKMADERYKDITVKMLLNHSSALPGTNYQNTFFLEEDTNQDYFQKLMNDLSKENLKANPGSFSVYCNEGFILAQKIVENVSGKSHEDYLNNDILTNMGVQQIYTSSNPQLPLESFVSYYDQEGVKYPREVITNAFAGTGGITTSANNLAIFLDRIMSEQYSVLNKDSITLLMENQSKNGTLKSLNPFNGLGWDNMEYPFRDLPVYLKSGGTTNYLTQVAVAPEHNITIVGLAVNPSFVGSAVEDLMMDVLFEKDHLELLNVQTDVS